MRNWFSPDVSGLIFARRARKFDCRIWTPRKALWHNHRLTETEICVCGFCPRWCFAPPATCGNPLGSPWFDAVVVITGLLMSWEWARMCCDGEYAQPGWVLTVGIAGAAAATMAGPLWGFRLSQLWRLLVPCEAG